MTADQKYLRYLIKHGEVEGVPCTEEELKRIQEIKKPMRRCPENLWPV